MKSYKGPQGGYKLAKSPHKINIAEIIRLMDGALAPAASVSTYFFEHAPIEKSPKVRLSGCRRFYFTFRFVTIGRFGQIPSFFYLPWPFRWARAAKKRKHQRNNGVCFFGFCGGSICNVSLISAIQIYGNSCTCSVSTLLKIMEFPIRPTWKPVFTTVHELSVSDT